MRALLLQLLYSVRSERQLVERIDYDLLFRWFVGLGIEDPMWDATTFTKNRDRLLAGEVAQKFLAAVLARNKVERLLSSEHFSVDGTLLEAWASLKVFAQKTARAIRPVRGATGSAIFAASGATTIPTSRPPIRMRGCFARGRARKRGWSLWGMR
jgi:hypothetical protein